VGSEAVDPLARVSLEAPLERSSPVDGHAIFAPP
jgi:hypothetical protein